MSYEITDIYQDKRTAMMLEEKWSRVLDGGKKTPKIEDDILRVNTALVLENTEKYIMNEENTSGDIGIFTPILVPALRRIYPQLLAHKVVGVQPMSAPTGYAFAERFAYAGSDANPISGIGSINRSGNANQNNPNSIYGDTFLPAQFARDRKSVV